MRGVHAADGRGFAHPQGWIGKCGRAFELGELAVTLEEGPAQVRGARPLRPRPDGGENNQRSLNWKNTLGKI